MRFAFVLCAAALVTGSASAQYRVSNKTTPQYTVTNKTAPCTYCASCSCAAGVCPACPTAAGAGEVLTTVSGKTIKLVGGVYVYADDEPAKVLDCSSGKCKWVDAPRGASASAPVYSSGAVSGGCASGQCGSAQSFRPAPRFAFPKK